MDTVMLKEDLWRPIPGAPNFRVRDALYLREWDICAFPSRREWDEILRTASKLQIIRDMLREPITVTSWLRPASYNKAIGGAQDSAHMYGMAVDFTVNGALCDDIRAELFPKLDSLAIRMEDKPGSNWVHIDTRQPTYLGRYFKP